MFLGLITIFAILMLAFPYYNSTLQTSHNNGAELTNVQLTTANLYVNGMTCQGCEVNVTNYAEAAGAESVNADYTTGETIIRYDKNRTNVDSIITNIENLGYKVSRKIC